MSSAPAIWCVGFHAESWDSGDWDADAAGAVDWLPDDAGAELAGALGLALGVAVAAGVWGMKSLSKGPSLV